MSLDLVSRTATDTSGPSTTPVTADPLTYDEKKVVGEVDQKYGAWRGLKRPHEVQWYVNSAMVRGVTNIRWNDQLGTLETQNTPSYKLRPVINKILPKRRQRKAKFLKTRYKPIVIPASSDREDKLNAVASQAAIDYACRKNGLEKIYHSTLDWSLDTGKGFIWLYWDDSATAMAPGPQGPVELPLGDIKFESGSPFELLTPEIGTQHIGDMVEIMRARARPLEDIKKRYANTPGIELIKGDVNSDELFQYQKQIAALSARTNVGMLGSMPDNASREFNYVVVKELFTRPNAMWPQGKYVVVAGGKVLKFEPALPYGFAADMSNPYPVVEFPDVELAGQFWATSVTEQLIGPQREYSDYRNKLSNHLAKQTNPKVIVSTMAKWPTNAWTDEAGEIIRIITPPGIPPPQIVVPPPISVDLWNGINLLNGEFHEIAGTGPVGSGETGGTTSGFQVSQLLEAADSVHAPDVRAHEMAFEELYKKVRRIMQMGYTVERLIPITGRAHIPDVKEFSAANIDENADIVVYTGSALSNSPAVRTQQVIELWNSGLLQDPVNPAEGRRRALNMLDSNGEGEFVEEKKKDETKARLENLSFERGEHVDPPLWCDDHELHYRIHTDQIKSPEFESWPDNLQKEIMVHCLLEMKWINPQMAVQTALEIGIPDIIPMLMPAQMPGQEQPGEPVQVEGAAPPQQQQQAPPPTQ